MTLRLAILDDYQGVALSLADWSSVAGKVEISVYRDHLWNRAALIDRLRPFDIIAVMRERTPLPKEVLERLDNLKLILSNGRRNASIDLDYAKQRGIVVCNTGYSPHGAMELTWALILAAMRQIPAEVQSFRQGGWQTTVGFDLKGKTLGIVGLGNIGREIAKVGQAFGMNTLAWSQNLTDDAASAAGVQRVDKRALFEQSDIVTVHLILSDRSKGVIGAQELAWMKSSAWLVNTSRGPLIDEAAMVEALRRWQIAGVALDVFDHEPLPDDHPLRHLDNVLATSHIGFVTEDTYRIFFGDMVDNLQAWLAGTPIRVV